MLVCTLVVVLVEFAPEMLPKSPQDWFVQGVEFYRWKVERSGWCKPSVSLLVHLLMLVLIKIHMIPGLGE